MKLVDSTFLIDVLRGKKECIKHLKENNGLLYTTQINMYEVIRGLFIRNAPLRQVYNAKDAFETIRVFPLDDRSTIKVAEIFAEHRKEGTMIEDCDCLTAGLL